MKKAALILAIVLTLTLALVGCSSGGDVKVGYSITAPHGTRSFAVVSVAVSGGKIMSATIDEFQFMANDGSVIGVPNSDADFGANYPEGMVLVSKRVNNDVYSANMADHGGATQTLVQGWTAIEEFAKGKTADQIMGVDSVASCTLVDTQGYLESIAEAARNAK